MFDILKDTYRVVFYHLISLFTRPALRKSNQSLLLIRVDAIGDYVLFRNFIAALKTSEKYKNHRITLLGNVAWKDLAMALDSAWIAEFIWLNRASFANNPFYRYRKLKELSANAYDIVLSPVFSRDYYTVDWLVKSVTAYEKIGNVGDLHIITARHKRRSDQWYTRLIQIPFEIRFEFYRNQNFFRQLIGDDVSFGMPSIPSERSSLHAFSPTNYVLLFIGASNAIRKWPISNYVAVAEYIVGRFGMDIALAGGGDGQGDADEFNAAFHGQAYNLVGKTTLVQLVELIANSNLLVSNETSAPHIAAALGSRAVVISNGNHFGRFTPYPEEMHSGQSAVYPPRIADNLADHAALMEAFGNGSDLDISEITVDVVTARIEAILSG